MISYQWCAELSDEDRAELRTLVTTAADYDEEAGFSRIGPEDVAAGSIGGVRISHLPIRARRDLSTSADAPMVLVAYLRVAVDEEGHGTVQFVVHPDYRSRGIATILVEELGLDVLADGGWAGTGAVALRCWAYGTHPASARLTSRFGVAPVSRLWTLFRHLSGPFAVPLDVAPATDGIVLGQARPLTDSEVSKVVAEVLDTTEMAPVQRARLEDEIRLGAGLVVTAVDESGASVGFVWFDPTLRTHLELRAASVHALMLSGAARGSGLGTVLLVRALEELRDIRAQIGLIRIDPDDHGAVRMCRLLSFEQEDEHSCFQVGEWEQVPSF